MTTSKRKGFFTASIILLLISLAVLSGALRLVTGLNHSPSSISCYDRLYIKAKSQARGMEKRLASDNRFPEFQAFITYVLRYPHTMYGHEEVILSYLNTITLPDGEKRHRFNLTETINGRAFVKPVQAAEGEEGRLSLILGGIAH